MKQAEDLIAAAIDAADDMLDPLEGLAEKTAADPGAPFAPESLEALAALKRDNRAGFETLVEAGWKKAPRRGESFLRSRAGPSRFTTRMSTSPSSS